jgi:hypothetical protein
MVATPQYYDQLPSKRIGFERHYFQQHCQHHLSVWIWGNIISNVIPPEKGHTSSLITSVIGYHLSRTAEWNFRMYFSELRSNIPLDKDRECTAVNIWSHSLSYNTRECTTPKKRSHSLKDEASEYTTPNSKATLYQMKLEIILVQTVKLLSDETR